MAHDSEEKEPAFKVVDKRRFTEEGDERHFGHHDDEKPKKEPLDTKPAEKDRPVMNFSLFVQSLVHQAMMGLGLVPWPDSGLVKTDLDLARQTIDILLILKEKTKGNLNAEEQSLLDGTLYQLQLAYVEVAKLAPAQGPKIG